MEDIPNESMEMAVVDEPTCVPQIVLSLKTDDNKVMAESKSEKELLHSKHIQLKLNRANIIINKLENSRRMLMKRVKRLAYEKKKLTDENCNLMKNIRKILNTDQIKVLHKKSARGCKWSDDTIRKALRLKLSCGSSGYVELLRQGIPLPAERTLRIKCENLEFQPGICKQVFDMLKQQVQQFTDDRERDCMLAVDEMSIAAGEQIDHSTMSYFGLSTLPDKFGKSIKKYESI